MASLRGTLKFIKDVPYILKVMLCNPLLLLFIAIL